MIVVTTVLKSEVATQPAVQVEKVRRRVGIMGGTFNPIHTGHLIMAEQVITQLGLDEILFMPNNIPPHIDSKTAIDGETRAKLIELAIADNPKFLLERFELERGGVSYSYDTIKQLRENYPDVDFYFIIGGDEVAYLPKWHRIDELLKIVTFVAVKRVGFDTTTPYPVIWVDVPLIEISSTIIRERIRKHQSIRYLVPQAVAKFIEEQKLYQDEKN